MRFGRTPARYSPRAVLGAQLTSKHLAALGAAPATTFNWTIAVGDNWQMFGNDRYGDCVEADTAHHLMVRTANAGAMVTPTTADVLQLYADVTGFDPTTDAHDFGTNESDMCDYLGRIGFLGHKSDTNARIDYTNHEFVKWACQLFGACRIGLQLPQYAMDQVQAGKAWEYSIFYPHTPIGGHDVPIIYADPNWLYSVSWGKIQPMSWRFFDTFCDEAHGEVFEDWIRQTGFAPNGLDLSALIADLQTLGPGT